MAASDVWFDFCFPYHAGSGAHSAAMAANRTRYCLLSMSSAESFERLYGCVDFAAMLDFNIALAEYFGQAAGETVRFTCPRGTDVRLTLDKIKLVRRRICNEPGMDTVPGTQSFYPIMESVEGRLVIQALFDEYYRPLRQPIVIEAAGGIRGFSGGGTEDRLELRAGTATRQRHQRLRQLHPLHLRLPSGGGLDRPAVHRGHARAGQQCDRHGAALVGAGWWRESSRRYRAGPVAVDW